MKEMSKGQRGQSDFFIGAKVKPDTAFAHSNGLAVWYKVKLCVGLSR